MAYIEKTALEGKLLSSFLGRSAALHRLTPPIQSCASSHPVRQVQGHRGPFLVRGLVPVRPCRPAPPLPGRRQDRRQPGRRCRHGRLREPSPGLRARPHAPRRRLVRHRDALPQRHGLCDRQRLHGARGRRDPHRHVGPRHRRAQRHHLARRSRRPHVHGRPGGRQG
jgi:hypothetical protein